MLKDYWNIYYKDEHDAECDINKSLPYRIAVRGGRAQKTTFGALLIDSGFVRTEYCYPESDDDLEPEGILANFNLLRFTECSLEQPHEALENHTYTPEEFIQYVLTPWNEYRMTPLKDGFLFRCNKEYEKKRRTKSIVLSYDIIKDKDVLKWIEGELNPSESIANMIRDYLDDKIFF